MKTRKRIYIIEWYDADQKEWLLHDFYATKKAAQGCAEGLVSTGIIESGSLRIIKFIRA